MKLHNKFLLIAVIFWLLALLTGWYAYAEESSYFIQDSNLTFDDANMVEFHVSGRPTMTIDQDGTVTINGKHIDKMDTPEIRDAMISIAKSLQEQSMVSFYGRQTDRLLIQLKACTEALESYEQVTP